MKAEIDSCMFLAAEGGLIDKMKFKLSKIAGLFMGRNKDESKQEGSPKKNLPKGIGPAKDVLLRDKVRSTASIVTHINCNSHQL